MWNLQITYKKGPSSQGYGFSSGHVWIWELDYKASWVPKNWCFWTVTHFSSCPQCFPASGSFPMSQFFTSGDQSIGVSPSASVLPMNIQDWFPLGLIGWISLLPKLLSRVFSNSTVQNINSSALSLLYSPTLTSIHDHWKNPNIGKDWRQMEMRVPEDEIIC